MLYLVESLDLRDEKIDKVFEDLPLLELFETTWIALMDKGGGHGATWELGEGFDQGL